MSEPDVGQPRAGLPVEDIEGVEADSAGAGDADASIEQDEHRQ
jgi:hypothetical protein